MTLSKLTKRRKKWLSATVNAKRRSALRLSPSVARSADSRPPGSAPKEEGGEENPDAPAEGEEPAEVAEVMSGGQEHDEEDDDAFEKELAAIPLPEVEPEQPPFRRHKKFLHYAFEETDY